MRGTWKEFYEDREIVVKPCKNLKNVRKNYTITLFQQDTCWNLLCVESVQYRVIFGPYFLYSVLIQENTYQN